MSKTNTEHDATGAAFIIAALILVPLVMVGAARIIHARELRQFQAEALNAADMHEGGAHHWDLVRAYNQRTRETWLGRRIVPAGWDEVEAIGGEVYRPAFTTETGRVIQ
jgi:hypothetical protein